MSYAHLRHPPFYDKPNIRIIRIRVESTFINAYCEAIIYMNKNTLYHYTNAKGLRGILNTKKLNPSLKTNNPQDARYGNGQYLSDIIPNTKTCAQLSRCFIGQPFQGNKFSHYIEIDITKFHIIKTKKNVFVIPNTKPINLTKIIISYGENL